MYIGEFVKEMETTKETIRYYIDEKLLTPQKVNGKYCFTDKEYDDFSSIRELREMGLSIRLIKRIKENKKECGTRNQWENNLVIIEDELLKVEAELLELAQQKESLEQVKMTLKSHLK